MLLLMFVMLLASCQAGLLSAIKTGVANSMSNVGQGVKEVLHVSEGTVIETATGSCDLVKTILGVDYSSSEDEDLNEEDLEGLTLVLYTNSGNEMFKLNGAGETLLASENFNASRAVCIIAHGFTANPDSENIAAIREALLAEEECNVLALDSSAYIDYFYLRSTTYVWYIGERLGEVLSTLADSGLDPTSFHLIGHSLGAHICGFTGKEFSRLTGTRVGRISGLDPAGPCFFNENSDLKLNSTDADYVFVLHTAKDTYGLPDAIGTSDFFPNDGYEQPGCIDISCSHSRAPLLFAESVSNQDAFLAVKCTGWDQFKENECDSNKVAMNLNTDVEGVYYFQTAASSPYGLGESGTIYNNTRAGVL